MTIPKNDGIITIAVKLRPLHKSEGGNIVAKNLEFSLLLDFYGEMLTQKQRESIEYYYNEDLSLSEISQNLGITRQGVRDAVKRAEALLYGMEERLGLAKRFKEMDEGLLKIQIEAEKIKKYNNGVLILGEISQSADIIQNIAKELCK